MPPSLDTRTQHLLRELAPQVLGAVIRRFRDFAASEDAVQEASLRRRRSGRAMACPGTRAPG